MRALDKIVWLIKWGCSLLLVLMVGVIFFQVVSRYCFGHVYFWAEELAVFSMIWLVFLGSVIAEAGNEHTRITFFVNLLPEMLQKWFNSIADLICIVFLAILSYSSIGVIEIAMRNISTGVKIPMGIVYMAMPVGGILMIIYFILDIVRNIKGGGEKG